MIKSQMINLGARIPAELKKKISAYCDRNGVKLQFFIMEAIQEKLSEIEQDEMDNKVIDERLKNPEFSSTNDLGKYLKGRKKNS
ncbi:MAG: hypothetical protein KBD53_06575 [Candidatus Omnitrophica bacterium]|nr:hypothetical protein [Candidatus Omnitrophota bacterium]